MGINLQNRISNFVTWIRPDPDKVEDARTQRGDVRDAITAKATADRLVVKSTPASGSFAKHTGLRRHMLGAAEHEGQDIDLAFVLAQKDKDGDILTGLLDRFERYTNDSYPDTPRERTKSSIKLKFVTSKLNFDIVPMLAVEGTYEEQILLRAGGERRRTSVQKHVVFTTTRTAMSCETKGATFNNAVRLLKWWREYQGTRSKILTDVPTFLMDLLCAKAFDDAGMSGTWAATLETWFDRIASYVS